LTYTLKSPHYSQISDKSDLNDLSWRMFTLLERRVIKARYEI